MKKEMKSYAIINIIIAITMFIYCAVNLYTGAIILYSGTLIIAVMSIRQLYLVRKID